MKLAQIQNLGWKVPMSDPPRLSARQWYAMNLLGIIFVVMAVLQLLSFADFKEGLANLGIAEPGFWAVVVVLAELWAAAGFFKLRLSDAFRMVSGAAALLASGFWFVANIQVLANGYGDTLGSSYFFGSYLNQQPGWLSVIEAAALLFLTLYCVGLTNQAVPVRSTAAKRDTKSTKKKRK